MKAGRYRITSFDTQKGEVISTSEAAGGSALTFETVPFTADLALAIRPA
jgi:hypothetical protein